jgi:thiamine-monophosphate kinase
MGFIIMDRGGEQRPALDQTHDMFRSEIEFVRWLRRRAPGRGKGLLLGIGDDAAVVKPRRGHDLILKSDLSIEGLHFLRHLHPPRAVGHRALARSLSDIAAMGGTPRYALISLAISHQTSRAWVREFYAGVMALARRFGVSVAGGDTAVVPDRISVDAVVAGEIARGKAVRRSGARAGDQLFVSGRLGFSALGLHRLKSRRDIRSRGRKMDDALRAHLYPAPRCAVGRYLSEKNLASALIDVSDGLSTDLGHLCDASGVGARVWAEHIPCPRDLTETESRSIDAMSLALHGGEDYELLFSVPKAKARRIPSRVHGVPFHWIGEVRSSRGISLVLPGGEEIPLLPLGYDHFKR